MRGLRTVEILQGQRNGYANINYEYSILDVKFSSANKDEYMCIS